LLEILATKATFSGEKSKILFDKIKREFLFGFQVYKITKRFGRSSSSQFSTSDLETKLEPLRSQKKAPDD
jgi:hypothetical protein